MNNVKHEKYAYVSLFNFEDFLNFQYFFGAPVGRSLEPLMEMFRMDEKVLAAVESFVNYL